MSDALAGALVALVVALTTLVRCEIHRRRVADRLAETRHRVVDVQRKVGADRRPGDDAV